MYYKTLRSTARLIPKYDNEGYESDFSPTDLVENYDCEACENCGEVDVRYVIFRVI
jgi:hypothetical protein